MKRLACCLVVLMTAGAVVCQAQVTPVVAKQRIVSDVLDAQGNVLSHSETLGVFLRNSTGSTITKTYSPVGIKPAIRSGQLVDYDRHKIYDLDYVRLHAVERASLPEGPHPEYVANAKTARGEETVNGLPCLIHSILMKIDGQDREIGKAYDSAEYGLNVKQDAIIEPPGGPRTRRIVELYDIQVVEPDPKEFALAKFSFLEKQPAACNKPGAPPSLDIK